MNTYVLLHFDIQMTSRSYQTSQACSSIQKFDNDGDVIFMFKM